MRILSLTFHSEEETLEKWQLFTENHLLKDIENTGTIEHFVLSQVENEMIGEGKNFNLLLFFKEEKYLSDFSENALVQIAEKINNEFRDRVMIFRTELKKIKSTL